MNDSTITDVVNHLENEKSPYLLQHAKNPVDWYPWGDKAFKKATEENKPIFLSIGYSTCHWCHVMAHESFENSEIGKLMNEAFVSIKVDREERPDIDNIYMTVCQMMTGSGGWPLTILMTPDKKPFFAGTYLPKESRFGRLGLIDLIKRVKNMWANQKEELLASADHITLTLQNLDQESPSDKFDKKILNKAYQQLSNRYDENYGGFGSRPKFPTPHNLLFLLRYWKRTGEKKALEMVEQTLKSMRMGGVYDHIGYGIHRYSTDEKWLVPHFEKMLYDQALVALAYIELYQATKNTEYSKIAQEIFTYVLRDMKSPEGGFYSAEDADSEGEEGKFYVWSKKEIEETLKPELADIAIKFFNVKEDGNFLEEATRIKTGSNILYLKDSVLNLSKSLNISEETLRIKLEAIRDSLYQKRKTRIPPDKDDKILTDWNGLMIAALARAAQVFSNDEYLKAAETALKFILKSMQDPDFKLLHRFRDGGADIDGYLTDYAFLIWGLIELYETTFNVNYLKTAITLHEYQIKHFWDDNIGGFYFTADNSEELLIRQKEIYDGAIPSGNSVAMLNLLRLSYITGDAELEKKADILSRVFTEKLSEMPMAYTQFMIAADFAVGPTYSLVIAGDADAEDTKDMISAIRSQYLPNKVLLQRCTDQNPPDIDRFSDFVEFFTNLDSRATAYICINKMCKPPTHEIVQIINHLKSEW
ncbi:MAG: thioredoxin domain-containing protein [Candidatus Heimdallarchaeota archaeon]